MSETPVRVVIASSKVRKRRKTSSERVIDTSVFDPEKIHLCKVKNFA